MYITMRQPPSEHLFCSRPDSFQTSFVGTTWPLCRLRERRLLVPAHLRRKLLRSTTMALLWSLSVAADVRRCKRSISMGTCKLSFNQYVFDEKELHCNDMVCSALAESASQANLLPSDAANQPCCEFGATRSGPSLKWPLPVQAHAPAERARRHLSWPNLEWSSAQAGAAASCGPGNVPTMAAVPG
jgi:hypothetical protein